MMSCTVPIPASTPNARRQHNWPKWPSGVVPVREGGPSGLIHCHIMRWECSDCGAVFERAEYGPRPLAQPKEVAL